MLQWHFEYVDEISISHLLRFVDKGIIIITFKCTYVIFISFQCGTYNATIQRDKSLRFE